MALNDLTGKRFGKLIVLHRDGNKSPTRWVCECDCGEIKSVLAGNLVRGITTSCGCSRIKDISGQKFGRLTALYVAGRQYVKSGKPKVLWHCKCDCGNEIDVLSERLINGNTKSCGCYMIDFAKKLNYKHGGAEGNNRERLFNIWRGMKQRCFYTKSKHYANYGGRGITVCDEWKYDYATFREWAISSGYNDSLTIERIDVNGNYTPENCTWIPRSEQGLNKTNNKRVSVDGVEKTIAEWSRLSGINRATITSRIKRGVNTKEAIFSKDIIRRGKKHE